MSIISSPDPITAEDLRKAAATLRGRKPYYIEWHVRVVQSDSEAMDAIAWCDNAHSDDPTGAYDCCETVEVLHPVLAQQIAALFNAREPLAAWLESAAKHAAKCKDPVNQAIIADPHAAAVARVILGGAE